MNDTYVPCALIYIGYRGDKAEVIALFYWISFYNLRCILSFIFLVVYSGCQHKHCIKQTQMAGGYSEEKNAGVYWLIFCVVGMVTSLTLYGIALEYVTIGGKKLHETSFIFVTTSIYTVTGKCMYTLHSFIY